MKIAKVEAAHCPVPLPNPIRLGDIVIHTRDFVALRVITDDGIEGHAIGYPRGTSLLAMIAGLAPKLIGRDPTMRRQIVTEIERGNVPGFHTQLRAIGLIDIALTDITAKSARLPLYKMLGGYRNVVPAMAVAGYFADTRTEEDIVAEVVALAESGYGLVKVVLSGADPRRDRAFLEKILRHLDGRAQLAVEAHWLWTTLDEAVRACGLIDDLGLAFIEDPVASALHWQALGELQARLKTPLAAGEDALGLINFSDLLRSVSILRVDATASGGVLTAVAAIAAAQAASRRVIPHVFTGLHAHLAAAFPNIGFVETIPAASGADPIDRLLRAPPRIEKGVLALGDEAGCGIDLDWDAVRKFGSAFHAT